MLKIKLSIFFIAIITFVVVLLISLSQNHMYFNLSGKSSQTISYNNQIDNHSLLPIASNQWYSSIYKNFPTQSLFAMPLAFKISPNGLSFSYPDVVNTQDTIFGSYNTDFTIGSTETFRKPLITQIGDWNIDINLSSDNSHSLSFFLAHGVPYTIIHATTKDIVISFINSPQIISQSSQKISNLVIKVNNHYYLLAVSKNIKWDISNNVISLPNTNEIFVGLLDKPQDKDLFLKIVNNDLKNTVASYFFSSNMLQTTYNLKTTSGKTLIALYPHQYDNLKDSVKILGSYKTIRGNLNLIQANSFTTSIPFIKPAFGFTKINKSYPELILQLNTDVSNYISQGPPNSKDYYLGTWFGKGISLLQLSDTLGDNTDKEKLLSYITPIFIKSLSYFSYQKSTTSLTAKYPEFGNELNNDHHFHYGYYIRSASILVFYEPSILSKISPIINDMVLDIANSNKNLSNYPYLRNFDTYESHSWADGFANFADGNNQESSSEAINAWYGVYLWGIITNNQQIKNTGLYLYNQEILGTKYYWFNIKNIYGPPYAHSIGSIIWGGKVDFATWFSADTNMKYGIELLPFTPGSIYLGTFPNFTKYENDYFRSGGNVKNSWGDLFIMWESFYDPKKAFLEKDFAINHESNTSEVLFLYIILNNLNINNK